MEDAIRVVYCEPGRLARIRLIGTGLEHLKQVVGGGDTGLVWKLLNISNEQMSYITNADPGCGLIRYGGSLVLFVNRFPRDTKLYQLMTTKPGEGIPA